MSLSFIYSSPSFSVSDKYDTIGEKIKSSVKSNKNSDKSINRKYVFTRKDSLMESEVSDSEQASVEELDVLQDSQKVYYDILARNRLIGLKNIKKLIRRKVQLYIHT